MFALLSVMQSLSITLKDANISTVLNKSIMSIRCRAFGLPDVKSISWGLYEPKPTVQYQSTRRLTMVCPRVQHSDSRNRPIKHNTNRPNKIFNFLQYKLTAIVVIAVNLIYITVITHLSLPTPFLPFLFPFPFRSHRSACNFSTNSRMPAY